jgi:Leucine-rich repeat (LRR) protein
MANIINGVNRGLLSVSELRIKREEALLCTALNLHNNEIDSLEGLPKMPDLTDINLSSNNLVSCSFQELSYSSSLKTLNIASNLIESLHGFLFLPNLLVLDLSYNDLTSLKGFEHSLPNLTNLNITKNKITDLAKIIPYIRDFSFLKQITVKVHPNTLSPSLLFHLLLSLLSLG